METLLTNYTMYKMAMENVSQLSLMESMPNVTETFPKHDNDTNLDDLTDAIWVWTIVDGLLMLAILAGNTLTILAVTLSRRLSSLISNQFVLNLAVSDLTVGLTLPYHLAFYLNAELGRVKSTCVLRFILITLACCASILNLIAIAVDRYIAILHPLHYGRYMSKGVTRALMALGWAVAVGVSVVPIFWNNWGMADSCDMHKVIPKEYTTNILAPMFSLIWLVMFVLYWRIWREAALHTKRMRSTSSSAQVPNDWKSVQVVLMVLGSFSMCWMPYVVVVCTQALAAYGSSSQLLYKAVFSLAMANSGINPVIYAWKNTGFRRAFMRLLRCRSPDCPDYENNFTRSAPPPKMPLQTISHKDEKDDKEDKDDAPETDKDTKTLVGRDSVIPSSVNNNGERCRIIENLAYDGGASLASAPVAVSSAARCHIIENMGFEDSDGGAARPPNGRQRPPSDKTCLG